MHAGKLASLVLLGFCLAIAAPAVTLAAEPAAVAAAQVARVNINTATVKELQSLPGIGKVTAERVVEYRTANGKFRSPDGLLKVKGIGAKTLEKIRDLVTVE